MSLFCALYVFIIATVSDVECWLTLLGSRNNDNNKTGDIN